MASFDIVSNLNLQEIDNAINQSNKEIAARYDFKGSRSKITLEKNLINIVADDAYKMKAVQDILQSKLVKRNISLKSVSFGKVESGADGLVKCQAKLILGIEQEKAKELVKKIKELGIKVQPTIQGDQVRVTSNKKDDLQQVIAALRSQEFSIPLQFTNYRD